MYVADVMFIIVLVNSKLEECSSNANFARKHGAYVHDQNWHILGSLGN
jgi:hypothetical protein